MGGAEWSGRPVPTVSHAHSVVCLCPPALPGPACLTQGKEWQWAGSAVATQGPDGTCQGEPWVSRAPQVKDHLTHHMACSWSLNSRFSQFLSVLPTLSFSQHLPHQILCRVWASRLGQESCPGMNEPCRWVPILCLVLSGMGAHHSLENLSHPLTPQPPAGSCWTGSWLDLLWPVAVVLGWPSWPSRAPSCVLFPSLSCWAIASFPSFCSGSCLASMQLPDWSQEDTGCWVIPPLCNSDTLCCIWLSPTTISHAYVC